MGSDRDLWSRYWRESVTGGCTEAFPDEARVRIANAWRARLVAASGERLLDVACGKGAVLANARAAGFNSVTGVDLATLDGADGAIAGGVDARSLPFADASFDVVVSQFGVEYAGLDAAALEAARVCRGTLILLVHAADGVVARQAAEQAAQVAWLDESRALERLRDHFRAPSHASAASIDGLLAEVAARAERDGNVALLEGVYRTAIALQDAADPIGEADRLARDLTDHAARMRALADAAPTRAMLQAVGDRLHAAGWAVTITDEGLPPIGRWLDARRLPTGRDL